MTTDNLKIKLLDELKLSLLQDGGVDNWDGYEFAVELFFEENPELDTVEENVAGFLSALDAAGVDNWSFYDTSLEYFGEYEEYVDNTEYSELVPFHEFRDESEELKVFEYEKKKEEIKDAEFMDKVFAYKDIVESTAPLKNGILVNSIKNVFSPDSEYKLRMIYHYIDTLPELFAASGPLGKYFPEAKKFVSPGFSRSIGEFKDEMRNEVTRRAYSALELNSILYGYKNDVERIVGKKLEDRSPVFMLSLKSEDSEVTVEEVSRFELISFFKLFYSPDKGFYVILPSLKLKEKYEDVVLRRSVRELHSTSLAVNPLKFKCFLSIPYSELKEISDKDVNDFCKASNSIRMNSLASEMRSVLFDFTLTGNFLLNPTLRMGLINVAKEYNVKLTVDRNRARVIL